MPATRYPHSVGAPSVEDWLDEDHLLLLEGYARDGYTYNDVAERIGTSPNTLRKWVANYPPIAQALKSGREIIDYKVENALLKSALGYKTKEVKITTTMRKGVVVETIEETVEKEMAPNVSAIQCWLYNRLPQKWKNMHARANLLQELADDEDTSIHIEVTRASKTDKSPEVEDEEWESEVNKAITLRKATKEEEKAAKAERKAERKAKQKRAEEQLRTQINEENEEAETDLDKWPDDWEDVV